MGVYRARDLWRVPGLLSLVRIPLAVAFPLTLGRPPLAFALLCLAGASDVLDGWYARRFGQATPTGAAIDPLTDKLFMLTVAIALVIGGRLLPFDVMLLSTRELAELPLVLWIAASSRARRLRAARASANVPGKVATVMQFATVAAALFRMRGLRWFVGAAAAVGAFAAATYWLRSLYGDRPGQSQPAA